MNLQRVQPDVFMMNDFDPVVEASVIYAKQALERFDPTLAEGFVDDDGPLWAWGIIEQWDRVGTAWLVVDLRACQSIAAIRHMVREGQQSLSRLNGRFGRIAAEFPVEVPNMHLAERLGFEVEGLKRNYGLGGTGDYVVMARYH